MAKLKFESAAHEELKESEIQKKIKTEREVKEEVKEVLPC